jgi:hypothetical protein
MDVRRVGEPWAAFWPATAIKRKLRIMLICGEKRLVTASTCSWPDTEGNGAIRHKRLATMAHVRLIAAPLVLSLALWGKPRNSIAFLHAKNVSILP